MFARITPFKMKPGSRTAAEALMHDLKEKIMGMPGMVRFINVMNEDGSGYVISVVESQAQSDANQDTVKQLWGAFAEHLEAMPTPQGYDLLVDWES